MKKKLEKSEADSLLTELKKRFEKNMHRHKGIKWDKIEEKLRSKPSKLWSLNEMEITGGEPDVTAYDKKKDEYIFTDCSAESPKGRRSICYDQAALESRKEHKPKNSAAAMAEEIGIELLNEEDYFALQQLEDFDTKTSSWLETPKDVRSRGGAIFGDKRYGRVFIYHNGAESYYGARGFRGKLVV